MRSLPRVDGMDALRTLTSMLGALRSATRAIESPQANYRKAVRLTGQIGVARRDLGPAGGRRRADRSGSGARPRRQLPVHADRRSGRRRSRRARSTSSLVLHADHELNASTFAARVAAATLTDIHSAIVARDRHAEGPAARRRQRRSHEDAARHRPGRRAGARRGVRAREARAQGEDLRLRPSRLPHRGSARDAPAPVLEAARRAGRRAAVVRDVAAHRSGRARPRRSCTRTSTSTRRRCSTRSGIPIDLYTPIFAVSRISGWTAHVLEQYANNRLIRPRTDYIGPPYPQTFLPLDQR